VVAAVVWYAIGRVVASANYGREDVGSALTHYVFDRTTGELIDENENGIPDVAEDSPPEPYSQDLNSLAGINFQLQLTEYDAAGQAYETGCRRRWATSLGRSALLGTVETSARMVSLCGSKQCHTRGATPVTRSQGPVR
jgi:hypothetical protein